MEKKFVSFENNEANRNSVIELAERVYIDWLEDNNLNYGFTSFLHDALQSHDTNDIMDKVLRKDYEWFSKIVVKNIICRLLKVLEDKTCAVKDNEAYIIPTIKVFFEVPSDGVITETDLVVRYADFDKRGFDALMDELRNPNNKLAKVLLDLYYK